MNRPHGILFKLLKGKRFCDQEPGLKIDVGRVLVSVIVRDYFV